MYSLTIIGQFSSINKRIGRQSGFREKSQVATILPTETAGRPSKGVAYRDKTIGDLNPAKQMHRSVTRPPGTGRREPGRQAFSFVGESLESGSTFEATQTNWEMR